MNNDQIIQEAKTYISSDKTIEETAKDLKISKRTLQLHLGKLDAIDPELHKLVLAKKESMQIKGRIKGGTIGKATPSYTKEEAEHLVSYMKTRFVRFLLSNLLLTQNIAKDKFQLIPIQDFTREWNDFLLYEKYELTEKERQYIEDLIKPI
jgi:hypothetical protein